MHLRYAYWGPSSNRHVRMHATILTVNINTYIIFLFFIKFCVMHAPCQPFSSQNHTAADALSTEVNFDDDACDHPQNPHLNCLGDEAESIFTETNHDAFKFGKRPYDKLLDLLASINVVISYLQSMLFEPEPGPGHTKKLLLYF